MIDFAATRILRIEFPLPADAPADLEERLRRAVERVLRGEDGSAERELAELREALEAERVTPANVPPPAPEPVEPSPIMLLWRAVCEEMAESAQGLCNSRGLPIYRYRARAAYLAITAAHQLRIEVGCAGIGLLLEASPQEVGRMLRSVDNDRDHNPIFAQRLDAAVARIRAKLLPPASAQGAGEASEQALPRDEKPDA
jgi:hypothetical protein